MYVLQSGKAIENGGELLAECLLRKLDLARIETSDSADFKSRPYLGRKPSLGAAQDNIKKLLARWHWLYLFPCGLHLVKGGWKGLTVI